MDIMGFSFPEFTSPTEIDAQRSWTAEFESYDQRHDDVYYIVTIVSGSESGDNLQLMAQIALWWAGDDWSGPEFAQCLHRAIHVVATGESNTTYQGAMSRPIKGKSAVNDVPHPGVE
ncbi:hypothetical protein J5X84_25775 [Streptosporangiaceae bacterium NEAU-GS5]|nr:hypothetical protein [Streptosporangiaceae bacterium NEAU-GS5]